MRISDWSSDVCSSDLWVAAAANLGRRWKEGRYGGFLLAPEDLALLDLCGFRNAGQANALFLFVRVVLCLGLPVAAVLWVPRHLFSGHGAMAVVLVMFLGFALGWMLPTWAIALRVRSEERRVGKEWVRTCRSRWSPNH